MNESMYLLELKLVIFQLYSHSLVFRGVSEKWGGLSNPLAKVCQGVPGYKVDVFSFNDLDMDDLS